MISVYETCNINILFSLFIIADLLVIIRELLIDSFWALAIRILEESKL